MGKRKICKIVFVILSIFLCVAFYELFGICIAYKKQPEVSNTIKKETQNDSWNERSENMERAVIIEKNPEALLQRVRLIRNAKEDIILSTFAFQSDESGKLILGALHDAADRGVHIRLLVDGMESWIDMEGNPYFYGLSSHENVEIKLYNKANPLKPWKMMGRMHDKYLIADGKTYILGGRNTYNYFLGDFEKYKNYDRDVLVICENPQKENSVSQLLDYFENIWKQDDCAYFHEDKKLADKASVKKAALRMEEEYKEYAKIIKPLVCDTGILLDQYLQENRKVLFEGAQGAMLDIDYGTYPYVTSSHPGANGVCEGAGIGPLYIKEAIGIIKSYTTRVGAGPFPTELNDEIGDFIRERGHEYGTVTKRPRRTGWFDAVVVNQSRRMSSLTGIALMLLDVLSGLDTIKICTAYKYKGEIIHGLPSTVKGIEDVEPVYEEMPGWQEDITNVKSFEELPVNCQNYIRKIEELVHCPVRMFSVGPDREQTVVLKDIKF